MSITHDAPVATSSLASIPVKGPFEVVARMWRAWRNRMAVARLADLDAHALRDIGLTPHDVRSALAMPLFNDPSRKLAQFASERWHAERAAARARRRRSTERRA